VLTVVYSSGITLMAIRVNVEHDLRLTDGKRRHRPLATISEATTNINGQPLERVSVSVEENECLHSHPPIKIVLSKNVFLAGATPLGRERNETDVDSGLHVVFTAWSRLIIFHWKFHRSIEHCSLYVPVKKRLEGTSGIRDIIIRLKK
jgi:hypothetical protein